MSISTTWVYEYEVTGQMEMFANHASFSVIGQFVKSMT